MRVLRTGLRCFRHVPGTLCLSLLLGCASYAGLNPSTQMLDIAHLKGAETAQDFNSWPQSDWWLAYADPALDALIRQALAENPDLQAVEVRVRQAMALAWGADSQLWPQLGLSTELTRMKLSEHGQFPPPLAGTTQNINEGKIGATWALDFFGKHRAALKAAIGTVRATEAEQQAARLLLASQVAQTYFDLARLIAQHALLQRDLAMREAESQLLERRYTAGLDARTEWEAAQGRIPEVSRDLAALEGQIALTRHALSSLSGQGPQALNTLTPDLPAAQRSSLPAHLPARLLGHRPDITAARWRVEAALQGLDVARALFYPDINLRAFVGYSSIGSLDHWLETGSRQPGLGLALNLPVFDADRLRAHYQAQTAGVDAALSSYNTTLLKALRDVADQQSTLQVLDTQIERQHSALASAERTLILARQRYQSGLSGRLLTLRAESGVIRQQQLLTDLQARQLAGRIQLTRALGGGYEETATTEAETESTQAAPPAPLAATAH